MTKENDNSTTLDVTNKLQDFSCVSMLLYLVIFGLFIRTFFVNTVFSNLQSPEKSSYFGINDVLFLMCGTAFILLFPKLLSKCIAEEEKSISNPANPTGNDKNYEIFAGIRTQTAPTGKNIKPNNIKILTKGVKGVRKLFRSKSEPNAGHTW